MVGLLLGFFQTEKRNWGLISLLVIILFLEGVSLNLEYKRNGPNFAFTSQEGYFNNVNNHTNVKFKLEFKNLGGRIAKKISVNLKLFCDDDPQKEECFEAKLEPRDKLPYQSMFLRIGSPQKMYDEVFEHNKPMRAQVIINHNEGSQTIWLKFEKDSRGLEELKWKEFDHK